MAPTLQAHAEDLKRSQLEDTLNAKLEHRPPVSELVEHNILHGKKNSAERVIWNRWLATGRNINTAFPCLDKDPTMSPALQAQADELKRQQLEDKLNTKLQDRPSPGTLIEKNILGKGDTLLRRCFVACTCGLQLKLTLSSPSPISSSLRSLVRKYTINCRVFLLLY